MFNDSITSSQIEYINDYCGKNDVVVMFRRTQINESGFEYGMEAIHGFSTDYIVEVSQRHKYLEGSMEYSHKITNYADAISWLEGGYCLKFFKSEHKIREQEYLEDLKELEKDK